MYNENNALMEQEKFLLPALAECDFSQEELAEDMDGLQMSFPRVKIPAGGMVQFEMPSDDPIRITLKQSKASFSTTILPLHTGLKEVNMMMTLLLSARQWTARLALAILVFSALPAR